MAPPYQQWGPSGAFPATANGDLTERWREQYESSSGLNHQNYKHLPNHTDQPDVFERVPPGAIRANAQEEMRLLTVDRALQFSPFSSIVPFSPGLQYFVLKRRQKLIYPADIVPIPTSDLPGPTSLFTSQSERHNARQPLEFLNKELANGIDNSVAVRNAEKDLKELLDPETLTDFKFKKLPRAQSSRNSVPAASNGIPNSTPPQSIGSFANRVIQQANLAYRYPTPISPLEGSPSKSPLTSRRSPPRSSQKTKSSPIIKGGSQKSQQKPHAQKMMGTLNSTQTQDSQPISAYIDPSVLQRQPVTPTASKISKNEHSYLQNGVIPSDTINRPTPQTMVLVQVPMHESKTITPPHPPTPSVVVRLPQTPQEGRLQPAVMLPPLSAESRATDFVTHELSEDFSVSRKRKRNDEAPSLSLTRDQRAEADEALRRLHEVIGDVLEADDEMQPVPSGAQSAAYEEFFVAVFQDDSAVNALGSAALTKLDSALQKVVSLKRLEDVPLDHLQRLQNLCMPNIVSAENADVILNEDSSSDEVESWIQGIEIIQNGLRSARTALRIMTGDREEKQLLSEELLQSITRTLKKAVDCLVPVVEARSSGPRTNLFECASNQRKTISQLLYDTKKIMALLVKLIGKAEPSDSIVAPLEYCAIGLLFVENASNEKDSVLGVQKFEILRRSAMDMITIIYSRYLSQRTFLFTELITSLQKLPVGRQAKRHYRLANGKSIQIVSALIMQLVQTSAMSSPSSKKPRRTAVTNSDDRQESVENLNESDNEAIGSDESEESDESAAESDEEADKGTRHKSLEMQRLEKIADGLCNSAARSASYAATYLVKRAQTSSKSGDQPHRQLLDIFVEDLLAVLSTPEWPAAELLLRALFKSFADIIDDPKSLAPAKTMALELLGMIGSAISEIVSNMQQVAKSFDNQDSELSGWLSQMVNDYSDGSLELNEILAWNGPFHAIVDSLHPESTDDLQVASAHGFCLAQWARAVSSGKMKGPEYAKLAHQLRMGLLRKDSLSFDSQDDITPNQSSVAYALVVLNMDLCRQFDYILKILLRSINTEAITVRTRALKSVTQMLEKDPTLLDRSRDFKLLIGQCTTDGSSMVRDNALTLISKCISLRPSLETEFVPNVLTLANDSAAGVRKRTIKLLKEMYLRNPDGNMRTKIVDCLLQRVQDLDAGVLELTRQTFEDIWMTPFWNTPEMATASAKEKIAFREQMDLIVQTAQRNENLRSVLEQLLAQMLSDGSKFAHSNFRVCTSLVVTAFEKILDATDDRRQQHETLLMLTVFAKAKSKLFTSDQIQMLQPYIGNLSSTEDLDIFRSIVIIFRYTLPGLSDAHQELRRSVQTALLGNIQKLYKTELNEVALCLWKLNDSLQNPEKLISLTKAVLSKLYSMKDYQFADPAQQDNMKRLRKYVWIAAAFGRRCDFESYKDVFSRALPWWKPQGNSSVADLVVQSMRPFANKSQPLSLQVEALQGIGNVCQAWPRQFTKKHISDAFEEILQKGDPALQNVVLGSFREFLHKIESQASGRSGDAPLGADASKGAKLGASATASEDDGASTLIAQYFLKDLLKVALATQNDSAFAAAEIITSINRQGLAHPKDSLPTIVALETSTNAAVADVALQGHRIMHQQHETALEPKYMQSVREAFRYQQEIVANSLGYTNHPVNAKLKGLWEVIRTSVGKYQKKFLSMFIKEIYVSTSNMDLTSNPPQTLQYSRFLTENLAFFEYTRLDELLYAISSMEKVVADNGSGLSHVITTEIFHVTVKIEPDAERPDENKAEVRGLLEDGIPQSSGLSDPPPASQVKTVDPARLYLLTANSIILTMLWEARTYLRRLYGQSSTNQRRENVKVKGAGKDLSKTPNRVQGVTSDKLISSIEKMVASLESEQGMMEQCERFVELLKIDNEVKVTDGSEEGSLDRPQTPDADGEDDRDTPMTGSSRGHKRKGSVSLSATPGKKKRARPSLNRSKSSRKSFDGDDGEDGEWM